MSTKGIAQKSVVGSTARTKEGAAHHARRVKLAHSAAAHLQREIPAPKSRRGRAGRLWARFLTALVVRFPVPSEIKWQFTLDFVRTLTVEYYEDLRRTVPEQDAQAMVSKALFASGRQWVREMVRGRGTTVTNTADLMDVLRLVFRTLNIDTSVELKGHEVLVTNFHCPYLVSAQQRGIEGEHMCEMICGDSDSMLAGINQGLPLPVIYRTNGMMGRDGGVCQKRFSAPV